MSEPFVTRLRRLGMHPSHHQSFLKWCTSRQLDAEHASVYALAGAINDYQQDASLAAGRHVPLNVPTAAAQLASDANGLRRPARPYKPGHQCARCGPAGFWTCRCT